MEEMMANKNKSKRDGTVLRGKQDIVDDYDKSNLPTPIKSILKLDYCWRLNYTIYKQSIYLSMPLTMLYFIWTHTPQVWDFTRKTFPFKSLAINYLACILIINTLNTAFSLLFEDYCDRDSAIYDTKGRNAGVLRQLIKQENSKHLKTIDGKAHKTLTEEEIMNETQNSLADIKEQPTSQRESFLRKAIMFKLRDSQLNKQVPQVFEHLDINPKLSQMRKKKQAVIDRVASKRIQNNLEELNIIVGKKNRYQSVELPRIDQQREFQQQMQSVGELKQISNQAFNIYKISDSQNQLINQSQIFASKSNLNSQRDHKASLNFFNQSQRQEKVIDTCKLEVPRIFKISKNSENVEDVKNDLRKNQFFHQEFNPLLASSESNAYFNNLYQLGQDDSNQNYQDIQDYFKQNKAKITNLLNKQKKFKIQSNRKIFEVKRLSDDRSCKIDKIKIQDNQLPYELKDINLAICKDPKLLFQKLQDFMDDISQNQREIKKFGEQEKYVDSQFSKSLALVNQKFESKQKTDPFRRLQKLGIDVILQNPKMLEQFEARLRANINNYKKENATKQSSQPDLTTKFKRQSLSLILSSRVNQNVLKQDSKILSPHSQKLKIEPQESSQELFGRILKALAEKCVQERKQRKEGEIQTLAKVKDQLKERVRRRKGNLYNNKNSKKSVTQLPNINLNEESSDDQENKTSSFDFEEEKQDKAPTFITKQDKFLSQSPKFQKNKRAHQKNQSVSYKLNYQLLQNKDYQIVSDSLIFQSPRRSSNQLQSPQQNIQQQDQRFMELIKFHRKKTINFNKKHFYQNLDVISSVDQILQQCQKYKDEGPNIDKIIKDHLLAKDAYSKELNEALSHYIKSVREQGYDDEDREIKQIIQDNEISLQEYNDFYMNPDLLKQFKEKSKQTSMYLAQHSKQAIWKPDKFQFTRQLRKVIYQGEKSIW